MCQASISLKEFDLYWPLSLDTGDIAVQTGVAATHTLVLGLGNILLSDDGVGIHVIKALGGLEDAGQIAHVIALRDGGTIGLALLSEIEEFGSLIVVDAMQLGESPGTVRAFQGPDMDRQLRGKKRSAHEVALADLMMAAQLAGFGPARRAFYGLALRLGANQFTRACFYPSHHVYAAAGVADPWAAAAAARANPHRRAVLQQCLSPVRQYLQALDLRI